MSFYTITGFKLNNISLLCFRMQQQQLAAQLANHSGSARQTPLSPTPNTSDSDSDISLGAHSPPLSSEQLFGATSPTPLTSFRFGPHSPGPIPTQFRFTNHVSSTFRIDRQSPQSPQFRDRKEHSPHGADITPSVYHHQAASPINVDVEGGLDLDHDLSPVRVDASSPRATLRRSPSQPQSHVNLHVSHDLSMRIQPETPLPLRLASAHQLSAPLRVQVSPSSPHTTLHHATPQVHGGIVRVAPQNPSNPHLLHRPFSPPRLTWYHHEENSSRWWTAIKSSIHNTLLQENGDRNDCKDTKF